MTLGDYERHGGLWLECWNWGELVGMGAKLGKVGFWGFESGITDPFLGWAPWGVEFPQVASTGDTCLLGLGTGRLLVSDWEMEK